MQWTHCDGSGDIARRDKARECYETLGIKGPAGLPEVVKEITILRKKAST